MGYRRDRYDFDDLEEDRHQEIVMFIFKAALVVLAVGILVIVGVLYSRDAKKQGSAGQPVEETGTLTESPTPEESTEADELLGDTSQGGAGEDGLQSGTDGSSQDGAGTDGIRGGADGSSQGGAETDGARGNTSASDGQSGEGAVSQPMSFKETDDTVTAKDVTNLRSEPGTSGDDTIVMQLKNGKTAHRTGINEDTGWSRLEYEGQTLYAVSRLLTTDLTGSSANTGDSAATGGSANAGDSATPDAGTEAGGSTVVNGDTVTTISGRTMTFTPCDDIISPKMEVNLRGEPSTDQGNDTIHYRMKYGETTHRTGINEDTGWSRVEYNGEVLYVVSSYIYVPEEVTTEGQ